MSTMTQVEVTYSGRATWVRDGAEAELNSREGVFTTEPDRPLPLITIRRYAAAASDAVSPEQREDGSWFAEAPELPGTWGEGQTSDEARQDLESVIFEWALLKIEDGDSDIPPQGGIDLASISVAAG